MERLAELIYKPYLGQVVENSRTTTPIPSWDSFWSSLQEGQPISFCAGYVQRCANSPQGESYWRRIYDNML